MSGTTPGGYTFLPWFRRGVGAGTPAAAQQVRWRVNDAPPEALAVRFYGPEDVLGIDPGLISRTDPVAGALRFEPNAFPCVEFADPAFPWRFTPGAATGERLAPWLVLIVVRRQEGVAVATDPAFPLPVLTIAAPASPRQELPDLRESWAWAHAQRLAGEEEGIARLLCPRRLLPDARYLACLVPAFAAGRLAGLGEAAQAAAASPQTPAWDLGEPEIRLPLYFSWEFATGPAGDFEALVRRLRPVDAPPELGRRPLVGPAPGYGLPDIGAGHHFAGVMRPVGRPTAAGAGDPAFRGALRRLLDRTAQADAAVPLLGPPLYGAAQAGRPGLAAADGWLEELNLDPALRAAAGLGAAVIQRHQEALLAAAWERVGALREANRLLGLAQLARGASLALHERKFGRFAADRLVQIAAPARARLPLAGGTLAARLRASRLPSGGVAAALRRLASPHGAVTRRLPASGRARLGTLVARLDERQPAPAAPTAPVGMVTLDQVGAMPTGGPAPARAGQSPPLRFADLTAERLRGQRKRPGFGIVGADREVPTDAGAGDDSPAAARFRGAAMAQQATVQRLVAAPRPARPALRPAALREELLGSLDPRAAIERRTLARLADARRPAAPGGDPLAPLTVALDFPQPMYAPLAELAQDYFLPEAGALPAESVALVEAHAPMIEAYMVGLNHEFGRELLWREFPAPRSATPFRAFWAARDTPAGEVGALPPLATWAAGSRLGDHLAGNGHPPLILLLRGEVIRRYPDLALSAVRGVRAGRGRRPGHEEHPPLFRGRLEPDLLFVGFDLRPDEARGGDDDPGWYLVIQEQPAAPRFGLDEVADPAAFTTPPQGWDALAWQHLADDAAALDALTHAPLAGRLAGVARAGLTWGGDAAQQAAITLQRPLRVAIHASRLLPAQSPPVGRG